jgi:hypothetical protein
MERLMPQRATSVLLSAALLFPLGFASAQTPTPAQKAAKRDASHDSKFKAADKNGDGALSKDELAAANPKDFSEMRKYFDQMDANKDGKVTEAERQAWIKAHPNAAKTLDKKGKG